MFVTAEAHAIVRFRRAIERRALWMAEDAARELPNLPLENALQLVHLYAGAWIAEVGESGDAVARSLSERGIAQPAGRREGDCDVGQARSSAVASAVRRRAG
jgi:hypothetical protein